LKAWAGADQCATTQTSDGGFVVMLSGSASRARGGTIVRYQWSGIFGSVDGPNATVVVPLGLHQVTLTVTTADGGVASDSAFIDARPASEVPPPQSEGCGCRCSSAGGFALAMLAALALRLRRR